ncbi:YfhO family protein [Neobacillus niacini]|uniref:YfhO family protein n=1 Tax=Neobacillus niacini TaxID=86668 RepID=UPI002FFDF5AE
MENRLSLKDKYFWILLLFMCLISGVLFFDFIIHKRLFIFYDIGGDTRQSYWPMYTYLVDAIREGTLRSWSFQIGLGTSTFTLYSFLFDPFIILLLLFPIKYLSYGILIISIVKILVSGILFYWYMNVLSIKKYPAVITSLIWAFNGYMMLWGQHYWFATMIVLFTFVMLALELWIRGRRKFLFPISIAIMGINSPYFLFMISLFIFFYVIFHYILIEKEFRFKSLFYRLVRFFMAYFVGLGAAAVVFLPVAFLLLSSPRTSGAFFNGNFFYLATYMEYISIFLRSFSNNTLGVGSRYFGSLNYYEGPMLSSSLLFIIALPQLLFAKSKLKNKIAYLAVIAFSLLLLIYPFFSTLFSAFSAFNYRWNYLLVFLNVLAIGYMLRNFSIEKRVSFIGLIVSAIIVFVGWYYSYKIMVFQGMIPPAFLQERYLHKMSLGIGAFLVAYAILSLFLHRNKSIFWFVLLCMVSAELMVFNYPTVNDRLTVSVNDRVKKEGYFDYTNEAVNYIKSRETGFFRIDKNYNSYSYNDSLFQNFNGVKSYNSLNHPSYISFFEELNTGVYNYNLGSGFDHRPILRDLASVKYVLSKHENVPSEYKKLETFGDVNVYENPNALPFSFTYDAYIGENEFLKLMPFEKDQALMNAAVMTKNNQLQKFTNGEKVKNINIQSFTVNNGEMVNLKDNEDFEIITTSNDPGIIIPLPQNELGWRIEFEIQGPSSTNGQLFWAKKNSPFNQDDSFFIEVFNNPEKVAYELNIKNLTELRFDPGAAPGTYVIRNFKIVPVEKTKQKNPLQTNATEEVKIQEFSNSLIKGNVSLDKKKLLFFSIPFDKAWTLKVDGKEIKTERVNMGFTGAIIPSGEHSFELEYTQPLLKLGILISALCWGIILWPIFRGKTRRKQPISD